MSEGQARERAGEDERGDGRPPHLDESVRRVRAAGKASLDSVLDTGRALRRLVAADLALARSATGRALGWGAAAIVFGASAWLLVLGTAIALLRAAGWSWLGSVAACALLSLVLTGLAGWRAMAFFEHAGMHATRRQLARFGFGQDDGGDVEDAPQPADLPAVGGVPGTPPQ